MLVRQGDRLVVPADSPLRARLAVEPVAVQTAPHLVTLPAIVEADPSTSVNVVTPVTGRLLDLKVHLGDVVKRGQVLATVSAPDLAQAVTDAQKARDALDLAQRALARARSVNETGANATRDIEAAQSSVTQQTAESRRSDARLQTLGGVERGTPTQALKVSAPVAGTVTALNVGSGAYLNDPNAVLMTVTNLDRVWVTINVPENLVGLVGSGSSATVTLAAYPGRVFDGRVGFMSPVLDSDTRRARARIAFANPGMLLKPNMYASATVALPQSAQPQVPSSALLMNNDSISVFVEVAPWTFVRRAVELGREDGNLVRIAKGLDGAERVVVRGGVLLND